MTPTDIRKQMHWVSCTCGQCEMFGALADVVEAARIWRDERSLASELGILNTLARVEALPA